MLYVRYVHLTKAKPINRRHPFLSPEKMLHKDYDYKDSVYKKKTGFDPHGAWSQDCLAVNHQSSSNSDSDSDSDGISSLSLM
jgi:hypothetical protein